MKIVFLILLLLPCFSQARLISVSKANEEAEIIVNRELIDYKNPSAGYKPTYLTFPKPVYRFSNVTKFLIKKVKGSGGKDFKEFEVYPRVNKGVQKAEVVFQDRTKVILVLKISKTKKASISYDLYSSHASVKGKGVERIRANEIDVMKAFLSRKSDLNKKKMNKWIRCKGRNINARLISSYSGNGFKVFQVRVKNDSYKKTFQIHPKKIRFRKRSLSRPSLRHVTSTSLAPRKSSVITLLGGDDVSVWCADICNQGEQLSLVKANKKVMR